MTYALCRNRIFGFIGQKVFFHVLRATAANSDACPYHNGMPAICYLLLLSSWYFFINSSLTLLGTCLKVANSMVNSALPWVSDRRVVL